MKKAVIKIPENIEGMEVNTNDIHPIVLVNALDMLQKHFARELVKMAEKEVGKNPKLQEQWLDRTTKKYLGDKGDFNIGDVNQFN